MPDWPFHEGCRIDSFPLANGVNDPIQIGAGTGANVKGPWTEITPGTGGPNFGGLAVVWTRGDDPAILASDYLVDIGLGPAGSEQVLVANLIAAHTRLAGVGARSMTPVVLPIWIPPGVRVSGRYQVNPASSPNVLQACHLSILRYAIGFLPSQPTQRVLTWGANTADSGGKEINTGTGHTKGAWVELVAVTEATIVGLIIGLGNRATSAWSNENVMIDVGRGAAGSEQVIIADYLARANAYDDRIHPPMSPVIPVHVNVGSRLAVRAQSGSGQDLDVVLYGIAE